MRLNRQILLCVLWAAGIGVGLYKAAAYSNTPAVVEPQPARWPADARVALAKDRPTLVLALHSECACSRATVRELGEVLASATGLKPAVQVLLFTPEPGSAEGELAADARALGAAIVPDPEGREAARFGFTVSGQTALYSPRGELLFSGGITRTRGHVGDNAGREAIVAILANHPPAVRHTPVFGCSLLDRS
jgi:hypothetical protein